MRTGKRLILLTSLLPIIQCAPYWALQKEYIKHDFSSSSCIILPVVKELDVQFIGDVTNEFGKGDTNTLIRQYVQRELPKAIQHFSRFHSVHFCASSNVIISSKHFYKNSKDTITYSAPQYTDAVKCDSETPDFLLILSDAWIGNPNIVKHSGQKCRYKGSYMPIGAVGGQNTLVFTAVATIWDNRANKFVCARTINATASHIYSPMIDISIWNEVIAEFASDFTDNMPFQNKDAE